MRIALLQLNAVVGAVAHNSQRLLESAVQAHKLGATLAIAPELAVTGYPPKDLLDRPNFVTQVRDATEQLIQACPAELALVFGSLGMDERGLTNDAVVARGGREIVRAPKQLLPSYDVFDEARHFEPGSTSKVANLPEGRLWLSVCEDAWASSELRPRHSQRDPLADLSASSSDLLVNISASPFTLSKRLARPRMFAELAQRHRVPVAFVNQVGGNDELIFDGRSSVWSRAGELIARARSFAEDVLIVDLPGSAAVAPEPETDEEAALAALVLGLRDYTRKCGFQRVVLALSGGIDSALTAAIAVDAVGASNVLGVAMPSRFSSEGSLRDAQALAKNLGIALRTVDIEPLFSAYLNDLEPRLNELQAAGSQDVTLENIQARIRGTIVMAISNRTGALVLTTGNKSELAVGYCTLYGDMAGGLSVISDIPKTLVYRLARFINRNGEKIPQASIDKPPSAELRPNQLDQDTLPPYDLLDQVLELFVEQQLGLEAIVAKGFERGLVRQVVQRVERAEYKRRQAAPGLIITRKAFGPGRRMPLANHFSEV